MTPAATVLLVVCAATAAATATAMQTVSHPTIAYLSAYVTTHS